MRVSERYVMHDSIDGGYVVDRNITTEEFTKRLGKYEDLGYSPEELAKLLDIRVNCCLDDCDCKADRVDDRSEKTTEDAFEKQGDTEHLNRRQILEKAIHATSGKRVQDYGKPERSFEVIAQLWEPFIRAKCLTENGDIQMKGEDAAAMMALFKLARVATGHDKADNFIDCCGYAACAGELQSGGIPDDLKEVANV